MSTFDFINVLNTNPATKDVQLTPDTAKTAGVAIVWAKTGTTTNTTDTGVKTNLICQSSQTLMLDGYSSATTQKKGCYYFKAILNFTLKNPIYTDDENDLCLMYIVFPSTTGTTYNKNQSFNVQCMMHNLGSSAGSPIYQITSTTPTTTGILPSIVIPINKWFAFRSPGSIYQLRVEGYSNYLCSPPQKTTNTCPCNVAT
jgi:hypothetical protein